MKQRVSALLLALFFVLSCVNMFAHSGRTDSSGGHYNRSTGEYHYHHGYSAHQHPGGVCPYDYDDQTGRNSGSSSSSSKNSSSSDDTMYAVFGDTPTPTPKPTATPEPKVAKNEEPAKPSLGSAVVFVAFFVSVVILLPLYLSKKL